MTHDPAEQVTQLLPCPTPWCGETRLQQYRGDNYSPAHVRCLRCRVTAKGPNLSEAIAAWNRRTPLPDDVREKVRRRIAVARMVLGMEVLQARFADRDGEWMLSDLFNDIAALATSVPEDEVGGLREE